MKPQVFKQEIEDGLEELILNDKAVCSFDIESCEKFDLENVEVPEYGLSKASIGDPDLFYFKAIHASTGMNLNDHYFLPEELWAAKDTASHKRINFEHEESNIIGADHISYAVDFAGKVIPSTTPLPNVPDKFDVYTKGVLYRVWTDKARQEFINDLIEKIQAGEYAVSMEALYSNWDYVLIDAAGKEEFIQRNRKTSHMTKHMRRFGGSGKYEGKRIGQVLRNMVFSGKGIVKKPANPRSQILEVEENLKNISVGEKITDSLVYSNTEGNNTMTDKEKLEQVEKELATATEANKKLNDQVSDFNKQVSELALANTNLNKQLDEVKIAEKELVEKSKAEVEAVKASLDEVNKIVTEYKFKEVQVSRVKAVKEKLELEEDKASEFVAKYEGFTPEQFEIVLSTILPVKKVTVTEPEKKMTVKELVKEATASLETAKTEESLNVSVAAETPTVGADKAKNDIVAFLSQNKKK